MMGKVCCLRWRNRTGSETSMSQSGPVSKRSACACVSVTDCGALPEWTRSRGAPPRYSLAAWRNTHHGSTYLPRSLSTLKNPQPRRLIPSPRRQRLLPMQLHRSLQDRCCRSRLLAKTLRSCCSYANTLRYLLSTILPLNVPTFFFLRRSDRSIERSLVLVLTLCHAQRIFNSCCPPM